MKTMKETIESVMERKAQYEKTKKARRAKAITILSSLVCICLVAAIFVIGKGKPENEINWAEDTKDYKILLDINPSIEILVDENNNIKSLEGKNEDGVNILEGMDLEGKKSSDGLKVVISEVVDKGYLSPEANSVLVSIEGAEKEKSEAIKEEIASNISKTLSEKSLEGAIIVQEISKEDKALTEKAETYGISAGKAQLIQQIIEQNKFHSFEELSNMSIHELNLLRVSYYVEMEDSLEAGAPAELNYIGAAKAGEIARNKAEFSPDETQIKLECRSGVMLYLVEFESKTHEYRYRINAVTGEILSDEKIEMGKDFAASEEDHSMIGEDSALTAALKDAGMENATLTRVKYNRDWVDGKTVYNLFFTDGILSGRYTLNARTGEILQFSKTEENHDRSIKETVIGLFEAKRIALAKDGLIDGNVSKYEITLTKQDSALVYDLSFLCNAARYTAQMDAVTGEVLNFQKTSLRDTGAPSVETEKSPSAER